MQLGYQLGYQVGLSLADFLKVRGLKSKVSARYWSVTMREYGGFALKWPAPAGGGWQHLLRNHDTKTNGVDIQESRSSARQACVPINNQYLVHKPPEDFFIAFLWILISTPNTARTT